MVITGAIFMANILPRLFLFILMVPSVAFSMNKTPLIRLVNFQNKNVSRSYFSFLKSEKSAEGSYQSEQGPSHIHIPKRLPTSGMGVVRGKLPSEIKDLIDFLKNEEKYKRMGAKIPHGLLMTGKPGVGKTLMGRSLAQELNIPFVFASASDFASGTIGDEQKNIKKLFKEGRSEAASCSKNKAIIFIDELDAIGSRKKFRNEHIAYRQALATLLVEIDNAHSDNDLYVFGASNTGDDIDPALKRPGRFDRIITVPLPDKKDREEILRYYAQATRYNAEGIDFESLAELTEGYTPADLAWVVNQAAINAVEEKDDYIMMKHYIKSFMDFNERQKAQDSNSLRE